jgi:MFS family permease
VVVSALSDWQQKRVRFLVLGLVLAVPGLLGVAFFSTPWLLYVAAFLLGFFLVPVMPIGMQYAAEVTYPTPEGTSNGLIQLFGQVSVVFVYIMAALRTADGSFTVSLVLASGLLIVGAIAMSRLRDAAPAEELVAEAAPAVPLPGETASAAALAAESAVD